MAAAPASQPLLQPDTADPTQQQQRRYRQYGSTGPARLPKSPCPSTENNSSGSREKKVNPETVASLYSRLTFSWMNPLFNIGYRRQLQEDDVWEMAPEHKARILREKLGVCWEDEKRKARIKSRKPSLLRAIARFALPTYWFGQVCLLVSGKTNSEESELTHQVRCVCVCVCVCVEREREKACMTYKWRLLTPFF